MNDPIVINNWLCSSMSLDTWMFEQKIVRNWEDNLFEVIVSSEQNFECFVAALRNMNDPIVINNWSCSSMILDT